MNLDKLKRLKRLIHLRNTTSGIQLGDNVYIDDYDNVVPVYGGDFLYMDFYLGNEITVNFTGQPQSLYMIDINKSFIYRDSLTVEKAFTFDKYIVDFPVRGWDYKPVLMPTEMIGKDMYATQYVKGYRCVYTHTSLNPFDKNETLTVIGKLGLHLDGFDIDPQVLTVDEYTAVQSIVEGQVLSEPIKYNEFTLQFEKEK